jgi:hypothetical protein
MLDQSNPHTERIENEIEIPLQAHQILDEIRFLVLTQSRFEEFIVMINDGL